MIYVDPPMPIGGKFNNYCHMVADNIAELHTFARRLGLRREWYQPKSYPHYDISPAMRNLAVHLGAQEVDRFTMLRVAKQCK